MGDMLHPGTILPYEPVTFRQAASLSLPLEQICVSDAIQGYPGLHDAHPGRSRHEDADRFAVFEYVAPQHAERIRVSRIQQMLNLSGNAGMGLCVRIWLLHRVAVYGYG